MAGYVQASRPMAVTTPLGKDALLLVEFEGQEAISQLFGFRLGLVDGPDLAVHKYKVCLSPISLRGQTLRAEQEEAADADS